MTKTTIIAGQAAERASERAAEPPHWSLDVDTRLLLDEVRRVLY